MTSTSETTATQTIPKVQSLRSDPLSRATLNTMDVFFAFNVALFLMMCAFAYYDRWVKYMGSGRAAIAEFFFYAVVLIVALGATWAFLRRFTYPGWLLVLVEAGIVAHFAGGLVHFGGARLYDHVFFGVRYDKYVHFANAFVGAVAVQEICRLRRLPIHTFTRLIAFLAVLGLGTGVEICEFFVTRTIPQNGVGGYDDNMRDLIANVCGGGLYLALGNWVPSRSSP